MRRNVTVGKAVSPDPVSATANPPGVSATGQQGNVSTAVNEPNSVLSLTSTDVEVVQLESTNITASRTGSFTHAVEADWAIAGVDTTPQSGTLAWDALEAGTKSVSIEAGAISEDQEFGTITLSNPRRVGGGSPAPVLGTSSGNITVNFAGTSPGTHDFTGLPLDADGWHDLDAIIMSEAYENSRIVYLSNAGNNSTATIYTQAQVAGLGGTPTNPASAVNAYSSVSNALATLRAGQADVVLLRRGDTFGTVNPWAGGNRLSGAGNEARHIIAAYGASGARPIISGNGPQIGGAGAACRYWIFADMDFVAPSIGNSSGIGGGAITHMLVENCRFTRYGYAIGMIGNFSTEEKGWIAIRRNVMYENYHPTDNGTGAMLLHKVLNGYLLIEQNWIDANGWDGSTLSQRTVFDRNLYIQFADGEGNDQPLLYGNVLSRGATESAQLRSGGFGDDNFIWNNPIGFAYLLQPGSPFERGSVRRNTILESDSIADGQRGVALRIDSSNVDVEDNLIANKTVYDSGAAINVVRFSASNLGQNVGIRRNTIVGWGTPIDIQGPAASSEGGAGIWNLQLTDNRVAMAGSNQASGRLVIVTNNGAAQIVSSGNLYASPNLAQGSWFTHNSTNYNLSGFNTLLGDTTSAVWETPISVPQVGGYMSARGLGSTESDFYTAISAISKWNFTPQLVGTEISRWYREQAGMI